MFSPFPPGTSIWCQQYGGGGVRGGGDPAVCHCFTEAPVESSRRLFEEATVINNYRAGTCSLERESDLPESPRELGFEPRTVRLQRQVLSMACVCGAPVTLLAVFPWFTVSRRSNIDCMENCALAMCMALTHPVTTLQGKCHCSCGRQFDRHE